MQEVGTKCDSMTGSKGAFLAVACPGVPEQGGQNRTSPGMAAGVSKDQIIQQVCGSEAGPGSRHKVNPHVRVKSSADN